MEWTDDDILAPLVRAVRADAGIQDLHSMVPPQGINPVLGPPTYDADGGLYPGDPNLWIFRNAEPNGSPWSNVEGTGSSAVVLTEGAPWSGGVQGSTVSYVTLEVTYFCDVTRDPEMGGPIAYDAKDKCVKLHRAMRRIFHRRTLDNPDYFNFGAKADGSGGVNIITSLEGRGLSIQPLRLDEDYMSVGQAAFELEVQGRW